MELLQEALKDTAAMAPFLLVIYYVIGYGEHRWGDRFQERIRRSVNAGPWVGALLGCIPQCGFSVVVSALYARGLVSLGTLIAVYLSTSDEALPVMLSQPERLGAVLPLLAIKTAAALIAGYATDAVFRARPECCGGACGHEHPLVDEKACCSHHVSGSASMRELLLHPLTHTAKILAFIFVVTLGLNWMLEEGQGLERIFGKEGILQTLAAALVGLIPNCAASVAIAQLYLKGALAFGAAVAGLSSCAGLGLLVLARENKSRLDTLKITGLLLFFSVGTGLVAGLFF